MPGHEELGERVATRSRIIMRIGFVENPAEAKKALDILSRGRQRALQKLLTEGVPTVMSSA